MKLAFAASAAILAMNAAAFAAPVTFPLNPNNPGAGDVTVDDTAFADRVVAFDQNPDNAAVGSPNLNNPDNVLGAPDFDNTPGNNDGAFTLGEGGFVTIEFTDNFLTTSGDSASDLFVGEVGSVVETVNVEISADNMTFISVGQLVGQNREIDIDAFLSAGDPTLFRFVRITDLIGQPSDQGSNPGADIDFVAALSTQEIPLPAGFVLMGSAVAAYAARRRKAA
jgi:hypothetical protein